jgi:hypothetical protein
MEIGIVGETYISSDELDYESDDYLESRYDEIIPNDVQFLQKSYNLYDNFFDHLEEISIFFVLFDNMKIHNLLKLRRINRFFRDIVNEYMILNDSKRIYQTIVLSYDSYILRNSNNTISNNIFTSLKNIYFKNFIKKNEHIIEKEYENKFKMIQIMRKYVKKKHIQYCKKLCVFLYMNNRVYTMCHCKDCYYNYTMKWYYLSKRLIFHMRKSVLIEK